MGVCIYDEFYFSGNKMKELKSREYPVIDSKIIDNIIVLSIQVTRYRVALNTGLFYKEQDSIIFLCRYRRDREESSSMCREMRVKTKKLTGHGDTLIVGTLLNGVLGLNFSRQHKRPMLACRGIARSCNIDRKHLLRMAQDILVKKPRT